MSAPSDDALTKKMVDAMRRLVPSYEVIAGKRFVEYPENSNRFLIGEDFHSTFISREFHEWCSAHNIKVPKNYGDYAPFMYTGDCCIDIPDEQTKILFLLRWS